MKKILLLIVVGLTFSTTGCAHKKRVKKLEEELSRCREKKAALSSNADLPETKFVVAAAVD